VHLRPVRWRVHHRERDRREHHLPPVRQLDLDADHLEGMMDLDPSLAFTALHDVSPEFRQLGMAETSTAITAFLADHKQYVAIYSNGVVKAGKTDMHTYARIWVKSYFGYES
jgi:hypothetical protein